MLKKDWVKGLLVIGCALAIFAMLYGYKSIARKTYTEISYNKLTEKIQNEEDFFLYVGSATCSACASYKPVINTFIRDNKGFTLFYIDTDKMTEDDSMTLFEIIGVEATTPQTVYFENGDVVSVESGALHYYYLDKFVKNNTQ